MKTELNFFNSLIDRIISIFVFVFEFRPQRRVWRIWLVFLKILAVCCLLLFCFYKMALYRSPIEKRYGMLIGTPDMRFFPCHIEPLMIEDIIPGSAMDKAGFESGDIIIYPEFHSVGAFTRAIDKPRGTVIEFQVISIDDFIPDCNFDPSEKLVKKRLVAP